MTPFGNPPRSQTLLSDTVDATLRTWVRAGWLRDLDLSFANFVSEHVLRPSPFVKLAAALASHQLGRGHAWLDLAQLCQDPDRTLAIPPHDDSSVDSGQGGPRTRPSGLISKLAVNDWLLALDASGALGLAGTDTPLVREGSRLYLRRYWAFKQTVDAALSCRIASNLPDEDPAASRVREVIDIVFRSRRDDAQEDLDWQRIACALAVRQRFTVITGGPGTGKTTTVVRLLAVLQTLAWGEAPDRATPLRIGLAAPTGKAAARLNESIAASVQALDLSELPHRGSILSTIPSEAMTLHRLLGARLDGYGFRHDSQHRLPLDVLVIDEASMIDLELMAAVCAALPAQARLILLGDKDQLASVEAGAVLGGLCERADMGHYLPSTAAWLGEATGENLSTQHIDASGKPLDQAVVKLRRSYRFGADSGIGKLAAAVNAGNVMQARQLLASQRPDLQLLRHTASAAVRSQSRGYHRYLATIRDHRPSGDCGQAEWNRWAEQVLQDFGRYRLLATTRLHDTGVEALNRSITAQLRSGDWLAGSPGEWFEGRPVLITRNDHALGLMNGDIGIALLCRYGSSRANADLRLRVAFTDSRHHGNIRWVMPARLRFVETAFAMTVHKAQGSEFEHAALLLPEQPQPVLSRELLYTAITRAKSCFTLIESGPSYASLDHAITSPTGRST